MSKESSCCEHLDHAGHFIYSDN